MFGIDRKAWPWLAGALLLAVLGNAPAIGLALGAGIALIWGNPLKSSTGKASKLLLQIAVGLLGFNLQFGVVLKTGYESAGVTLLCLCLVIGLGILLGRLFSVGRNLSLLISCGTAICGGSAIAALAPIIGAAQADIAVAMAVVFLLNGVALIIFPLIGHALDMSQMSFGLWSALAIHDTSSVVGAGAAYGAEALSVGTMVKLTRALWIVPLAFVAAKFYKSGKGAKIPPFIIAFVAASALASLIPAGDALWAGLAGLGRRLMTATLFLVGACLTREDIKLAGKRSLASAIVLWVIVSCGTLAAIMAGWLTL